MSDIDALESEYDSLLVQWQRVVDERNQLAHALRILGWRPGHCFCPTGSRRHTDECVAASRVLVGVRNRSETPHVSDQATASPSDSGV